MLKQQLNLFEGIFKKPFFILWVLCLIGSCAVLPYIYYLGFFPATEPILKILLISIIQAALLFALICFLSFKNFAQN